MKISLELDGSMWLRLPRSPEGSPEAAEWENGVIKGMAPVWGDTLNATTEPLVREALRNGLRHVSDDDSVTLQFWPNATIANAIVHISASPFADGEARQSLPMLDLDYISTPVSEVFETESLGRGIETRYLVNLNEEPPLMLGGVSYVFQNEVGFVAILVEPTLLELIGVMLEPLHEVIRSISVIDDVGGHWGLATVDEAALPSRGEDWPE